MTALVATAIGFAAFCLAVRLYMGRDAERHLAAAELVEFKSLKPVTQRNVFVMCPAELCPDSANEPSPVFNMRWERLRNYWEEMMKWQPRVEEIARQEGGRRLGYIQRSAFFRFPDVVTVEFLALPQGHSTIAVHSRSRYGRRDFGVNARRVDAWVSVVQRMMREDQRVNLSR
jgi:uncharacterized protein (DUF1499 family)